MRLEDFKTIRWGKEDEDESEEVRSDIIYKVFLGDRQVWEKTDEEDEEQGKYGSLSNSITTTWKIVKDFNLANLTAETNITGNISWGDSDSTYWRSGQPYYHHYTLEGTYNITAICRTSRAGATIGQFCESPPYATMEPQNTLIGVSFGKIPYANNRLGQPGVGVFENIDTIIKVTIPKNLERIPPRLLFGTSIRKVDIPIYSSEVTLVIEDYAIVSNAMEEIYVPPTVSRIGEKALGFTTNLQGIVPNLKYYCVRGSVGAQYAIRNGITPIYGTYDGDTFVVET